MSVVARGSHFVNHVFDEEQSPSARRLTAFELRFVYRYGAANSRADCRNTLANHRIKDELGYRLLYPNYRTGLAALRAALE
jgi:hypothetical protein